MPRLLLICVLLLCYRAETVIAQTNTTPRENPRLQALLAAGKQHLEQQRFHRATTYFSKAQAVAPRSPAAHYYLAECQRHLFRYAEALRLYQAARDLDTTAFPAADFYQALMQKHTGAYRAAHQSLNNYVARHESSADPSVGALVRRAQEETQGIALAYRLALSSPPDFAFRRLPAPINSSAHDYAAQPLHHDSSLMITSARTSTRGSVVDERYGGSFGDLLFFKKEQQRWQTPSVPHPLSLLNSYRNEGNGVLNATQDRFYFTGCYQDSTCHIFLSERTKDKWSEPIPLSHLVNQPGYNAKHPALSPGGDTLYFTSDRPGGHGQYDIWMSRRVNGTWRAPTNLGLGVNGAYREVSPTYYDDKLVFASNRPAGVGGYDLYVRQGDTTTNLGPPFNSAQDDLFLSVGQRQAFLTSNRNNPDGNFDLYTFSIHPQDLDMIARRRREEDTDWYEFQLAVAVFAPEDRSFYEQLSWEDKLKVKHYVDRQAFRKAVTHRASLTDTVSYRYRTLPAQEQALVRRLVQARKQFLTETPTDAVRPEDAYQYQRLSPTQQQKIVQAVDYQWFTLLLQENTAPDAPAVYFYEQLPPEDQQRVERAVPQQQRFYQRALEQLPDPADIFYYQSLPAKEQAELTRMVAVQQFVEKGWEARTEQNLGYVYDRLDAREQSQIKRYIRRRSFQEARAEEATLSEETQQYYATLSPQQKSSVAQLARTKKRFLMKEATEPVSPSEVQFYRRLPPEEKEMVAQVVNARVFAWLQQTAEADADPAAKVYQQLPTEAQTRVDRVVAQRKTFHQRHFEQLPSVDDVLTYQTLAEEEKTSVRRMARPSQFTARPPTPAPLDQEATVIYEKLSRSDQESVGRLVDHRKKFLTRGTSSTLLPEDRYFLATLSTEEKKRVQRVVEARVFDELLTEDTLAAQLIFRYHNLRLSEQNQVDRIARSRRLFAQMTPRDTSTPLAAEQLPLIGELPTERVTVNGRLTASYSTSLPPRVYLIDQRSDTLAAAPVAKDGTFVFENIDYEEHRRVVIEQPTRTFTPQVDYYVEELAVTTQGRPTEVKPSSRFGHLYFATNRSNLSPTATNTLDSVVQFHRQYPTAPIEIRAFADSTGTVAYNLQLTGRRAQAAQRYLVRHGVASHCLSQWAMGAIPGDDLAHCRRVELTVGLSSPLPSSGRTIYLIQTQPNLQLIAERYQVSLEQLKEWNGGKETIAPYTPVRIVK